MNTVLAALQIHPLPHGCRNFYTKLGALVWNLSQEQHWGNLPWKLGLTSLASSMEQPDVISLHSERVCMQGIQFWGQWPRNGSSDSPSFYHPQNFTPIGSNPSLLGNSDRFKCQVVVLDGLTFFSKSSKRSRCYHYSVSLQARIGWVRGACEMPIFRKWEQAWWKEASQLANGRDLA